MANVDQALEENEGTGTNRIAEARHWLEHPVRVRIVGVMTVLEDAIYLILALLFFAAALYIMGDAVVKADWHSISSLVGTTLDRLLLVLMLGELVHTLMIFVKTHRFRYQPFLVVGIIAGIRRILVITAEQAVHDSVVHMGPYLEDLAVTTLMVAVLTLALRLGSRRDGF